MKLVETENPAPVDDVTGVDGDARPPRPEHRRVGVSLIFTLLVLVATVVTVYLVVPKRHNALMEATVEAHETEQAFELVKPERAELRAWSLALMGREVPWPESRAGVEILGARSSAVLNRAVAIVQYRVDGQLITVLVQRPREALPQDHRREHGGLLCVSWRRGKIRFAAVGPLASASWRELFHAPR